MLLNNIGYFFILLLNCLFLTIELKGQDHPELPDEIRIERLASQVINAEDREEKLELNKQLKTLLSQELSKSKAFGFPFDSVKSISILTPPDSAFRLFNWSVPFSDGSYRYECGLMNFDKAGKSSFFYLEEVDSELKNSTSWDHTVLKDGLWPGGLYYQLITKSDKLQTYYILLNWDGHNRLTDKKSIDVLWFDAKGEPRFGAPIFVEGQKQVNRVLFQYQGEQALSLRYEQESDQIEFNQLYPLRSDLEGVYEYYYPGVLKDAYKWENQKWVFIRDINTNESTKKDRKKLEKRKKEILIEQTPVYQPKSTKSTN